MQDFINIAKGKMVNATGGNTSAITDGMTDAKVHWDGGVAPKEVTVDLEQYYHIRKIKLFTYYGDGRYYHFKIFLGVTPSDFEEVVSYEGTDEATENGYVFDIDGRSARYVKVLMTKNSDNPSVHIADLQVFGEEDSSFVCMKTTKKENPDPLNIAYQKPVRASVNNGFSSLVTDGEDESCWIGELYPRHLDVDLQENYLLKEVKVVAPKGQKGFSYTVYVSLDGVHFDFYGEGETDSENRTLSCKNKAQGRVVRVLVTGSKEGAHGASMIAEVKAYGEKTGSAVLETRKKLDFSCYENWLAENEHVNLKNFQDEKGDYDKEETYTEEDTKQALYGLITRVLGEEYTNWFVFHFKKNENQKNYFTVFSEDGKVAIQSDCGVSAARGLYHYLKEFCHVQVSQQTKQVSMPEQIILPEKSITREAPSERRYAYNYCTLSYTMPYFNYERWQRELDYLFLQGVNLILDPTGIDAVWVSYLQKLGFTTDEAKDYLPGYCYSAWFLMGNLEGYCGPVADAFLYDSLELARKNQRYMTVMGADPCYETFVGAMPATFASIANAHLMEKGFSSVTSYMAPQGLWAGGFVRPNVLRTDYDGYTYLAKLFYDTQKELLGEGAHYYCGDVCHEGGIVPKDLPKYEMSRKILDELLDADEKAVWLLQGWWSNPMKEVLDGFGNLKNDHIMILDLAALAKPKWTDETTWDGVEFGNTPWIFCNLDNYGGRIGMHGKLQKMSEQIAEAYAKAKVIKGIGITPEGTNQNPVVFELLWEMGFEKQPPVFEEWLENYVLSRYGKNSECLQEAWRLFAKTVYGKESYDGTSKNHIINENASLSLGYCANAYYKIPYDRRTFEEGVCLFMKEFSKFAQNEGYIYDAVDFLRTVLSIAADDYFDILKYALQLEEKEIFKEYSEKFLDTMHLVSEVSTYNEDDLMGNWLGKGTDFKEDPKMGTYSDFDLDMMEINGKALVTTWASAPITNYGNRQYNGLMEDYYIKMWEKLFENVENAWRLGEKPEEKLGSDCFKIGWDVVVTRKQYRREVANPLGDQRDRGLLALFDDVKKHLWNETTEKWKQSLKEEIDRRAIEAKKEVSATIATNIEH